MKVDVILGLQYGDEGKGKVCHSLLNRDKYTHVLRFNGGGNAGHTIYHEGKKFVTHLIPSGVFYGIKSVIGPGCVINVQKLFEEINYLESNGVTTQGLIWIAKNAHVVQPSHLAEDGADVSIGTTKTGNGPAYRDKYARVGLHAQSVEELKPYLIDMYEEFYANFPDALVLAEGAQAFGLDVDWGDYPYVTSSHCGLGSLLLNGFTHKHVRDVYGIIKAYDTYVGAKTFQPEGEIFSKIQTAGQEFGATTGRKRQCNWLDWDLVSRAIAMNGVNRIVVNKVDILDELDVWNIRHKGRVHDLGSKETFISWIKGEAERLNVHVQFSFDPYDV